MNKAIVATLVAFIVAVSAHAGPYKQVKEIVVPEPTCKFRNTEFQLDLFGAGGFYDNDYPNWGGGLGANFFFLRYIGIGVEQDLVGRKGLKSEWSTIGNFFLRYPICSWNLTPYAMVGGGGFYGNAHDRGAGHVGGGVEVRFTNNIGLFTDARWFYSCEDPRSSLLARSGLRIAF
jgi:hypothetical protein